MFGPYSTWMTLPSATDPTAPGAEKVKKRQISDRDSTWRRVPAAHGFHQNPHQPWQYYLDKSCRELESLLGKKPVKTQQSAEESSLNLEEVSKSLQAAQQEQDDEDDGDYFLCPEGITRIPFRSIATDYSISRRKSGVFKIPPPLPPSLPLTPASLGTLPSYTAGSYHLQHAFPQQRNCVASGMKTWAEAKRQKRLRVNVHKAEDHSVTPVNSPHSK